MIKRDYYEVLQVEKTADNIEIKKAYRRLAMQYHPDRNPGDKDAEESFKEASEAYEVLSDPQKKQTYDRYGHQGLEGTGFSGFGGVDDIFSSFGDVFEDFFGGMGGFGRRTSGARAQRGRDILHNINISFEESAFGTKKEIKVKKDINCSTCKGSGLEPGTHPESCKVCGGTGQVTHRQGFFVLQSACAQCGGKGKIIKTPCKVCRGLGRVQEEKKLEVKVPAGVENGMRLVLRGEGEAGYNRGPSGDMYVEVAVKAHEHFERQGNDIFYRLEISFPEAALGIDLKVPTLYGAEKIKIHSGTQSGDIVRIKSKGVPDIHRGHKGDQIVVVKVVTPKKLSKKQKHLLEEFLKESK